MLKIVNLKTPFTFVFLLRFTTIQRENADCTGSLFNQRFIQLGSVEVTIQKLRRVSGTSQILHKHFASCRREGGVEDDVASLLFLSCETMDVVPHHRAQTETRVVHFIHEAGIVLDRTSVEDYSVISLTDESRKLNGESS